MSKIELNTETGPIKELPILEETLFNTDDVYTVEIGSKGVQVYSECCGALMSRETAIAVRDGINKWLEQTA